MSFIKELKRRNVVRVGIAYLVVSWLALQVADVVLGNIGAPEWLFKALLTVIGIGLPVALLLAWAFELTPDGLKRDHEVDEADRRARPTARLNAVIIAALSLALAYFVLDKFVLQAPPTVDAAGVATEPATIGKSIVVLPFANRSVSTDDAFFVDGMHDDILTQLSKLSTLDKVISRTTAMSYSGSAKPVRQIADELGVATVLEGGVQRAGDTIRINMQLIDARTDKHLWAEIFERKMTVENLFAIQTEITREVVAALNGVLSDQDRQQLDAMPTDSLAAYKEYALGRQQLARRTGSALERALEHFRRATELDPGYELAWVGVADVLTLLPNYAGMISVDATVDERRAAVDKALAINPSSGEAYTALAALIQDTEGSEKSVPYFERAIELNPNYPTARHWYSLVLRELRRFPEALIQVRKARDVDPASAILGVVEAGVLMNLDRMDEAEQQLLESIRRNPGFHSPRELYAARLLNKGQLADALRWAETAAALAPDTPASQTRRCAALAELGFVDEAAACNAAVQVDFPELAPMETIWSRIAVAVQTEQLPSLLQQLDNEAAGANDMLQPRLLAATLAGDFDRADALLRQSDRALLDAEPAALIEASPALAFIVAISVRRNGDTETAERILDALDAALNSGTETERRDLASLQVSIALLRGDEARATTLLNSFVEQQAVSAWWALKAPVSQLPSPSDEWRAAMQSLDAYIAAQRAKYLAERDSPLLP